MDGRRTFAHAGILNEWDHYHHPHDQRDDLVRAARHLSPTSQVRRTGLTFQSAASQAGRSASYRAAAWSAWWAARARDLALQRLFGPARLYGAVADIFSVLRDSLYVSI